MAAIRISIIDIFNNTSLDIISILEFPKGTVPHIGMVVSKETAKWQIYSIGMQSKFIGSKYKDYPNLNNFWSCNLKSVENLFELKKGDILSSAF